MRRMRKKSIISGQCRGKLGLHGRRSRSLSWAFVSLEQFGWHIFLRTFSQQATCIALRVYLPLWFKQAQDWPMYDKTMFFDVFCSFQIFTLQHVATDLGQASCSMTSRPWCVVPRWKLWVAAVSWDKCMPLRPGAGQLKGVSYLMLSCKDDKIKELDMKKGRYNGMIQYVL